MWKQLNNDESYYAINRILSEKIKCEKDIEDKIEMIDYFITMIKKELSIVSRNKVLYKPFLTTPNVFNLFPSTKKLKLDYFDKIGIGTFHATNETIVFPWSFIRLCDNFLNLKNKMFEIKKSDSQGCYIQELDLLFITKGNHSFTTFINLEQANLILKNVDCYSIKKLFDIVETNSEYWINVDTKKKIQKVKDARIALLFFLAKKRITLFQQIESNRKIQK